MMPELDLKILNFFYSLIGCWLRVNFLSESFLVMASAICLRKDLSSPSWEAIFDSSYWM